MFFKRIKKKQPDPLSSSHLISFLRPHSNPAEQFRTIRTNINFAQFGKKVKSILVSSSVPKEGKTTLSANLAYVMAQTGKKVLLVDADLRRPTVHRTFNLNNDQGLATLIAEEETIQFEEMVQFNQDLNLYFLPSGPPPPNPSELLGSAKMQAIVETFHQHFDFVIYDAPSLGSVTDPQILAAFVDGLVFVVRRGYVSKEKVHAAITSLQNLNTIILGYVLNDVPKDSTDSYYYHSETE